MATAYYGRHLSGADTDFGNTLGPTSSNERATAFKPMTEDGWGFAIGGRYGALNAGNTPYVRNGVWALSGGAPGARIAYTGRINPSTQQNDQYGGANYEAAPENVTAGYGSTLGIKLVQGVAYAVGWTATLYSLGHSMIQAATLNDSTANNTLYRKNVSSQPPTDPMAPDTSSYEGWIDAWIHYQKNRQPSNPSTGLYPLNGANLTTTTPTFQADFADADTVYGDSLFKYTIQVRLVGTTTLLWNHEYTATGAEVSANAVTIVYAGSALSSGNTYEWRVKVADQFGFYSYYSNQNSSGVDGAWRTFSVNVGGTVTIGVSPTGKQSTNQPGPFLAKWSDPGGLSSTSFQVDILNGSTVVQTTNFAQTVLSTVSPGTSIPNLTWANLFGSSTLPWSSNYTWRIRGTNTSGVVGGWSSSLAFSTDYSPLKPVLSSLTPNSTSQITSYPPIGFTMTDPDDTAAGLLSAKVWIQSQPYLVNGSFVTDLNGWTATDNSGGTTTTAYTRDVTVYTGGAVKANITANTHAAGLVTSYENTAMWSPCVVGESYTIDFVFRTTNASVQPRLQINWYNAAKALISSSTEAAYSPLINTDYARTFTAVAPANAVFYRIAMVVYTTAGSGTLGTVYASTFSPENGTRFIRNATFGTNWTYQTVHGTDAVQTITFGGTVTGGTYTASFNGATSAAINWNDSAATVQTKLLAMSSIPSANGVVVTGGPGPTALVVTFSNDISGTFQNAMTVTSSLTGTAPTVSVVQTTLGASGDVAGASNYYWKSQGTDTILTGPFSDLAVFVYAVGPAVTITAPITTSSTASPLITWTAPGQVKARVLLCSDSAMTVVLKDTGTYISAVQSYQVPQSLLANGQVVWAQVFVTNSAPLTGSNTPVSFTVSLTPPATITGFSATPTLAAYDIKPSVVVLQWDPTQLPPGQFGGYLIGKRITGADVSTEQLVITIPSPNQTSWTDDKPTSGISWTWSIRQVWVLANGDTANGLRAEDAEALTLEGVIVSDVQQGTTLRMCMRYDEDRMESPQGSYETLPAWGGAKPWQVADALDYQIITGKFILYNDSTGLSALTQAAGIRSLMSAKSTVCYRDERMNRVFGLIHKCDLRHIRVGQYEVDFELHEAYYVEGT